MTRTHELDDNPLLQAWDTPYGLPPFDRIRAEHFVPALEHAMAEHRAEIDAIASNAEAPSFENTIAAFDASGRLFKRVSLAYENLTASETSPDLQEAERILAPRLAAHLAGLYTHDGLFARVDAVNRLRVDLLPEARRLLERLHLDFELAGARLTGEKKTRYVAIVEELASLTTSFEQNVLADEASFSLPLTDADCEGLPSFLIEALTSAASQRALPAGTRAIVLSRSIVMPFLTLSPRRDLREKAWRAWTTRGEHEGAHDNRPIAKKILALRAEQASLRDYPTYADAALVDRMAKTPEAVFDLLAKVWEPAKSAASRDRAHLLEVAKDDGLTTLAPWDWRYYAEKVRRAKFEMDDAELKPFFALDDMIAAMFDCATKLFGVTFERKEGVPLYHPDVRLYEMRRGDRLVGIFLSDNYARPTKRGGAWMHSYRKQSSLDPDLVRGAPRGGGREADPWSGSEEESSTTERRGSGAASPRAALKAREQSGTIPIVVNNNNFAKAPAGAQTLLSFDDVRTLFHEFGHGLHGLLSNARYETLSGTEVLQDYVELPSQIFEHWAQDRGVLAKHARHVETRSPIPDALLDKLERARRFDQAFATIQYVGSALLDMALHKKADREGVDLTSFEASERARLGVPEDIGLMHRLPHFRHLFSSAAYAAGYYVYMWAEVLDADGFEAFREAGDPFHAETAERLHRYVYSAGNTIEPSEGYRAFRGRDASVDAMLKKRGLLEVSA